MAINKYKTRGIGLYQVSILLMGQTHKYVSSVRFRIGGNVNTVQESIFIASFRQWNRQATSNALYSATDTLLGTWVSGFGCHR
jgi:hypothetical protein